MAEFEKRLADLELTQQLLVDIEIGHQPAVSRVLLTYLPGEVRAFHGFMKWIATAPRPLTWGALAEEWCRRLPHRTASDLATLWEAYRKDGLGDGPVFQLRPE